MSGYELAVRRADEAKQVAVGASRAVRDLQQQVRGRTDADRRQEHRQNFVRHALVRLCMDKSSDVASTAAVRYPRLVSRAAVSPATSTTPGWAAELTAVDTVGFLMSGLAPSLLARLAALALNVTGPAKVPVDTGSETNGAWIGEGQAIPVVRAAISSMPILPRKVAAISVFSGELKRRSNPEVEAILDVVMRRSLNKLIDTALADDQPASTTRSAGLRNGVAATPAGTSMAADLAALAGAVIAAGGESIAFLVSPLQSLAIGLAAGSLDYPVLASPHVPPGTVIAVDPTAVATMIGAALVQPSDESTLMLTDDATADLMAGGVPVQSMLQADLVSLRAIVDCAWGSARTAWMEGVTW
jgi:hypothetical protein